MPKRIFLPADGTGNAAASPFKTNVWRLYQAIDQIGFDQIAFYTDGVGTETFKPLRALGGAFGIGIARNVKGLYRFLCRNYDPEDRIFLFGFSRGAFTVRILAGLILRCGIVQAKNEDLLTEYIEHAYSVYKRSAASRATASRWLIPGRRSSGLPNAATQKPNGSRWPEFGWIPANLPPFQRDNLRRHF